ncbi:MAG: methyltransferase domain-containing protein [Nanoarchaeota archaeon]
MNIGNLLVKLFGHIATVFFGDPAVFDRYIWLRRHLKKGSLRTFDAGSGSGAFTMYAAKIGNEAVGISFGERNNKMAEERARILGLKNIKFITADLNNLNQLGEDLGKFDQIICFEIIEHILDDRKLVRNLSNLLKQGGQLLLTTPYKNCPFWKDAVVPNVENGDHVRVGYDTQDLDTLFKEEGIKLVKEDYVSGYISQRLILIGQSLSRRISSKKAIVY